MAWIWFHVLYCICDSHLLVNDIQPFLLLIWDHGGIRLKPTHLSPWERSSPDTSIWRPPSPPIHQWILRLPENRHWRPSGHNLSPEHGPQPSLGCRRNSSAGGSWRTHRQGPPPDATSPLSLIVWVYQICPADSPITWSNSPLSADRSAPFFTQVSNTYSHRSVDITTKLIVDLWPKVF